MRQILIISFCLATVVGIAQSNMYSASILSESKLRGSVTSSGLMVDVSSVTGQSMLKTYGSDIEGSPYLVSLYIDATITASNNQQFTKVPVKFNLETDQVYFKDSTGAEMVAGLGSIKKLETKTNNETLVFKSGFPAIKKNTTSTLYLVHADGKASLLEHKLKVIKTNKNEMSGEISKIFEDANKLYFVKGNVITEFVYNKKFITDALKDQESKVQIFITDNKTNFKKLADIKKLLNYYNRL